MALTRRVRPDGKGTYCYECRLAEHRRTARDVQRKRKYGITKEEYQQMFLEQDGRCAICGTNEFQGSGGTPHVDHDHITGKVRGILCHHCNTAIGQFGDSIELMLEAIAYLKERS